MRRILLIDDEPDIRAVARVAIEVVAGWACDEAASGAEGLAAARELKPDAVLIDMMMPGMDGIATAEAFRADADCAAIPLLFLTANGPGGDPNWLVDGVIGKPFDPMTLGNVIAQKLGWAP